jgi:hypothetical protein
MDEMHIKEHFEWEGRFAIIAVSVPGWHPSHPLDLPRSSMSAEYVYELTYENEPLFRTRERAIARCAYDNKERLRRNQYPGAFWNIVIELLPTFNFWAVVKQPDPTDDADGKLTAFDMRFKVVEPTDEERTEYLPRVKELAR